MLEGLFGSNFRTKCKTEIKAVKARIELVRRRAEAKQRFLKEDLSKLLINGLDENAFSRTEEYLALQNIRDSYDFVEQACEYINGQLSSLQKLRECPEDCREAVGSLIFAAARFSDLPELRDLRDLLKRRYGNSFECFVNQKFLEKLSSKPPEKERQIKLLKDIASEYSLKWDVKDSEQRMAPPSAKPQIQSQSRKHGSNNCQNPTIEKRSDLASGDDQMRRSAKGTFNTREDNIQEPRKDDVLRHGNMHVNDGEKRRTDREGLKRDCSIPELDRRDATKQRPGLDKPKGQEQPGLEKKSEVASDGGKMPRSREGTFHTRVDNILEQNKHDVFTQRHIDGTDGDLEPNKQDVFTQRHIHATDLEPNKQDLLMQRHIHVNDADKKHRSSRRNSTKNSHRDVNNCENEHSDREGFRNPNSIMEGRPEILLPDGKATEAAVKFRSNYAKEDTCGKSVRSRRTHDAIRSENVDNGFVVYNNGVNNISNGDLDTSPFHGRSPVERQDITSACNYRSERGVERLRTDVLGENRIKAPPYARSKNSTLPPKPRDSNHRCSTGSRHEDSVSAIPSMYPSFQKKDHHAVDFLGRIQKEADQSKHEKERAELFPPRTPFPEDFDLDHNGMIPLAKPRAIRRKHRHSLTHVNLVESTENAGAIRRSSSSRRREHSRKGLQIISDDETPKGDREEKNIDKMLLYYSKKPSSSGIEKPRPKSNDHHAEQSTVHAGKSSRDQRRGVHDQKSGHISGHTRSYSVPADSATSPKDIKAFARVKSFQPDDLERHVHPKLPDYDDFVAQLAAFRKC